LKIILTVLLTVMLIGFVFPNTALAEDTSNGAKIFTSYCSSCHLGGGNILLPNKTLYRDALSQYLENYNTDSIQAIIYQVKNGKGAMPAFKNKLSEQEILEISAYVFQKAEKGWSENS
jgi:cytochrome c6